MNYQHILPPENLQKYVRYFWVLEAIGDDKNDTIFKIIPDGFPGLIFQERPNLFLDKENLFLPQLFLYGQTTQHSLHKVNGAFRNIGVYFQPTALNAIFNLSAFELTNQNISMDCLVNEPITEQLVNAVSINEKISIISNFLLRQIHKSYQENSQVEYAYQLIQSGKKLNEIQSIMNLSERSLERLLKHYVGISPKMFSRIIRFQAGLNTLRNKDFNSLTDLAYQNDYFDQSHYIREFKEFTGTNPKQFIQQSNERVENFPEWKI